MFTAIIFEFLFQFSLYSPSSWDLSSSESLEVIINKVNHFYQTFFFHLSFFLSLSLYFIVLLSLPLGHFAINRFFVHFNHYHDLLILFKHIKLLLIWHAISLYHLLNSFINLECNYMLHRLLPCSSSVNYLINLLPLPLFFAG